LFLIRFFLMKANGFGYDLARLAARVGRAIWHPDSSGVSIRCKESRDPDHSD
jgi:hypothetical protein